MIINRSGEAIEKTAIFENDEEEALASDFTMRVRFNQKMNPRFAWYYFRSVIFQSQVLREIRRSSVLSIFPPQVSQMLVVSSTVPEQAELAAAVDSALASIDAERLNIEGQRKEIQDLIRGAII